MCPQNYGGERQIAVEAGEIASLLDNAVSTDYAKDILIHAKGRVLIALQSSSDITEILQRCIDSVYTRSQGRLDRAMAEKVAVFVLQRLAEQQQNPPSPDDEIA